jgi:4-amino-4-deoxy-L-arabinose transferase-like glycosyltransferase
VLTMGWGWVRQRLWPSVCTLAERWTETPQRTGIAVAIACYVLLAPRILIEEHHSEHTSVHQAAAFLDGSLSLEKRIPDTLALNGRYYVVFPPMPAIVLLPLVAIMGTGAKTLLLTPALAGLIAGLAYRLLLLHRVSVETIRWMVMGLVFGTSLTLCVRDPIDTYLAHLIAVTFCLLGLYEAFTRQRGLLVGLALGCAVLSRQLTVFLGPFLLAALWLHKPEERSGGRRIAATVGMGIGVSVCLGVYLWMNWARFGDPFDSGYSRLIEPGWYQYRLERWGNFHWIYIPSNLMRLFLLGFDIEFRPPSYLVPTMSLWGTSLTYASPFLYFAFRGRLDGSVGLTRMAWASIGVIALAVLAHKSALGGSQMNALRYTLDFLPLVLLLAARGLDRYAGTRYWWLGQLLIVYSIATNVVAYVVVPAARTVLARLPH